jgi:hypothetical protein
MYNDTLKDTTNLWEVTGYSTTTDSSTNCKAGVLPSVCKIYGLNFYYYNGYDASNTSNTLGIKKSIYTRNIKTDFKSLVNFKATFKTPPYLIPINPKPINSALITRPARTFPTLLATTNFVKTFNPQTEITSAIFSFPEMLYSGANVVSNNVTYPKSPLYAFSAKSKVFYNNNKSQTNSSDAGYFYFYGTIKATAGNATYSGSFDLLNKGEISTNITSSLIAGGDGLVVANPILSSTLILAQSNLTVYFTLKPDVTKTGFRRDCFKLSYNNWDQKICIYANVVTDTPDLEIKSVDAYLDPTTGYTAKLGVTPTTVITSLNSENPNLTPITISQYNRSPTPVYKKITVTNLSTTTSINNFAFYFLGRSPEYTDPSKSLNEISSYKDIVYNPNDTKCTYGNKANSALTLLANQSCTFFIKFSPNDIRTVASKIESGKLVFSYEFPSNQTYTNYVGINFETKIPPKLQILTPTNVALTTENINPWINATSSISNTTAIPSYKITLASDYEITGAENVSTYIVKPSDAVSTMRLLRKGCTSDMFFADPNQVACIASSNPGYVNTVGDNNNGAEILATSTCINGFTQSNPCHIQSKFTGLMTYLNCKVNAKVPATATYFPTTATKIFGGTILSTCNPYANNISYIINNISPGFTYIHYNNNPTKFIKPNRSLSISQNYSNVSISRPTATTANITFTIPSLTPSNSSYGSISKLIIFYSKTKTNLDGVFFNPSSVLTSGVYKSAELTSNIFTLSNVSLTSIGTDNTKIYEYYFKVFAVRTDPTTGLKYYSEIDSTSLDKLTVMIPTSNEIYDYSSGQLIDSADALLTYNSPIAAQTYCASKTYTISRNGAVTATTKKNLIKTAQWATIVNQGHPGIVPSNFYWLNEATDIFGGVSIYANSTKDYIFADNGDTAYLDYDNNIGYNKNSQASNILYKTVKADVSVTQYIMNNTAGATSTNYKVRCSK